MTSVSSNKRIAKNTAYLYIRMLVSLFVGLYTSRIVLKELGIVDYGLNNVVGSLLSLFTFIQGSLSTSASRFLAFEIGKKEKGDLNKVFCMTQNIHFIFAVIVLILAETIGLWYFYNKMVIPTDRFNACLVVYHLSILSAVFSILVVPYNAMIIAQEKMKAFAYLSIVNITSKLLIALSLGFTPADKLIAVLGFILSFIIRILYLNYCSRYFEESKYRFIWDKSIIKEMLIFSGWSMCSYTRIAIDQASNLMLNLFFGPVVNAARAVANTVQQNIYAFVLNFQVSLNPQIIKSYAIKDNNRIDELVNLSQKISFSLLFILMFPILVNLRFILNVWLVEVPEYTEPMLLLICITSIFSALSNPFGVIAEASNKLKKWNLILMPYYILSAIGAYIMIKLGASVIMMFGLFLVFEFAAFFIKLKLAGGMAKLQHNTVLRLYAKMTFTVTLALIGGYYIYINFDNNIIGLFQKSLIVSIFSIIWIPLFILDSEERSKIQLMIISRIRR